LYKGGVRRTEKKQLFKTLQPPEETIMAMESKDKARVWKLTMEPTIFVRDVGAPHKENIGWTNADGETGLNIGQCIEMVNRALPVGPV
jgi:hypothetical protein